jgi:hypothetical protein
VTATASSFSRGGGQGHCSKNERSTPWGVQKRFWNKGPRGWCKGHFWWPGREGGGAALKEGGACWQAEWSAKGPVAVVLLRSPCTLLFHAHPQSHPGCPQCKQLNLNLSFVGILSVFCLQLPVCNNPDVPNAAAVTPHAEAVPWCHAVQQHLRLQALH